MVPPKKMIGVKRRYAGRRGGMEEKEEEEKGEAVWRRFGSVERIKGLGRGVGRAGG